MEIVSFKGEFTKFASGAKGEILGLFLDIFLIGLNVTLVTFAGGGRLLLPVAGFDPQSGMEDDVRQRWNGQAGLRLHRHSS